MQWRVCAESQEFSLREERSEHAREFRESTRCIPAGAREAGIGQGCESSCSSEPKRQEHHGGCGERVAFEV